MTGGAFKPNTEGKTRFRGRCQPDLHKTNGGISYRGGTDNFMTSLGKIVTLRERSFEGNNTSLLT